jgi:hypothetical protein
MAKLTKETLKKLLKECLVELLQEENMFLVKESVNSSKPSQTNMIKEELQVKDAVKENPYLKEAINNLSNSMLDKNKREMFADIFEDTAKTTYQDMLANDINYRGPVAPPTEEQRQSDVKSLEEIAVGGDLSRWAKVAFAGSK